MSSSLSPDAAARADRPAPGTPRVSVVVPVYNPGAAIDECVRSLLAQSLPPEEYELVFVDDGSTDATPARLDALEREHANVRVRHIPNSGWPGRPRNLGLDMARGEYVLFVDNDDWLGREALERMHATAVRDDADIVIGKIVGVGKPVPPTLFEENRAGVGMDWPPLPWLLTPHRLFRRSLLERYGLRFPEGRRRLEDHVFVLGALFRAERVSVLADYPCYHWVLRDRETNASAQEFDAEVYYRNLLEVLDVVDEHTEPGALRDRLYTRYYRGKVLSRVGGLLFHNRAPDARRLRFEEIRSLVERRFSPALDARMAFAWRLRAQLVRAGTVEQLERLAALEVALEPRLEAATVRCDGPVVELGLSATVRDPGDLLVFRATGDGVAWRPPAGLRDGLPEACLDASGALDANEAQVLLRRSGASEEFLLPARVATRLVPDAGSGGDGRLALDIDARLDSATAAAGRRLPAGEYLIRAVMHVAGFRLSASVVRPSDGLRLTVGVAPGGDVAVVPPRLRQRVAARVPALRAVAVRAREALRRG